jgi:hypothetical protein
VADGVGEGGADVHFLFAEATFGARGAKDGKDVGSEPAACHFGFGKIDSAN